MKADENKTDETDGESQSFGIDMLLKHERNTKEIGTIESLPKLNIHFFLENMSVRILVQCCIFERKVYLIYNPHKRN